MARGHDRFDTESGGGSAGFVMGLLTGTVLGAGLGMLFAPRAGSELRSQLTDQAGNLANQASEGYRRATANAGEWVDGARDMSDKARDAVSRGAEDAQRDVRDAVATMSGSSPAPATLGASGSPGSGSFGSGASQGSMSEGSGTGVQSGSGAWSSRRS